MAMLSRITITAFKCLDDCQLELTPLTLLTGPNSAGKSTVIQALLLLISNILPEKELELHAAKFTYLRKIVKPFSLYDDIICRNSDKNDIGISLHEGKNQNSGRFSKNTSHAIWDANAKTYIYDENLFYLRADRTGPEEIVELDNDQRIGDQGQYAFGSFEQCKDKPIHEHLQVKDADAKTLKAQLAWWLSYIIGEPIEAKAEKVSSRHVKVTFIMGDIGSISPLNTGAGNSYLLKLLIMCLTAKPGDLLLIENPEIHLHPGAQSRLGKFLAFLAAREVQIIAETHCEHLINRIRYEVYKKELASEQVIIHYKPSAATPFTSLKINEQGHFCDLDGNEVRFPSGFFDSTLQELLEIG
ncbi:AAA family ATPase [Chrysiogenes arsenatis]|uniref:AAA family ATPase n=1 Tax=Chrysiogenes arsenatis TaxID=309797 RepID=UPI000403D9A2|nr:AAA family ATPase [Chrysiogenes arsenatis]